MTAAEIKKRIDQMVEIASALEAALLGMGIPDAMALAALGVLIGNMIDRMVGPDEQVRLAVKRSWAVPLITPVNEDVTTADFDKAYRSALS
jgi:uncharacterized protein YejL (UPF0352 family)